ncbi:hypothetical protein AB6A40_011814, partial [Gnathostoma spinigerum]
LVNELMRECGEALFYKKSTQQWFFQPHESDSAPPGLPPNRARFSFVLLMEERLPVVGNATPLISDRPDG